MNYWLVKTEEDVYPIDELKKDKETTWDGVRNYQARNFLQDMKKGDTVFVYHSNAKTTGIAGLASVKKEAEPDLLQFDRKSPYYDPKSSKEAPRWFAPTLSFKKKFSSILTLEEMKTLPYMKNSRLLQKGNRLSVLPITEEEATKLLAHIEHS
jgi:predicted RNA-binding protein with PUA-like domain